MLGIELPDGPSILFVLVSTDGPGEIILDGTYIYP
jgi:hypothetical protein